MYMAVMESTTASVTSSSRPESQASSKMSRRALDVDASGRIISACLPEELSTPSSAVVSPANGV